MKKLTLLIGVVILTSLSFTSCSSVESDAKKLAEIRCEIKQLMKKSMAGDESVMPKIEELGKKSHELTQVIEEKYTSPEKLVELQQAVEKELESCE